MLRRSAAVSVALLCAACSHGAQRSTSSPLPIVTGDYPAYGHAPDYAWIAGRIAQRPNGCAYIAFTPSGNASYGGRLALNARPDTLSSFPDGDMVVAFGRLSSAPQAQCGRAYTITRVEEH